MHQSSRPHQGCATSDAQPNINHVSSDVEYITRNDELSRRPVNDSLFRHHNGTQHNVLPRKADHVPFTLPGTDDADHLHGRPQQCRIGDIGFSVTQPWNPQCYDVCFNIDPNRIHPSAAQALACLPIAKPTLMTKLTAYTDGTGGSKDDGDDGPQPAWASALLGTDLNGEIFSVESYAAKSRMLAPMLATLRRSQTTMLSSLLLYGQYCSQCSCPM